MLRTRLRDALVGAFFTFVTTASISWIATSWPRALGERDSPSRLVVWLAMLALGAAVAAILVSKKISATAKGISGTLMLLFQSVISIPLFGTASIGSPDLFRFSSIPTAYVIAGAFLAAAAHDYRQR